MQQESFSFEVENDPLLSEIKRDYRFFVSGKEVDKIFSREIYQEVIKSEAFQRLKKIKFLGAIDYTLNDDGQKPNEKHTRYHHSLCVAKLALAYSKHWRLSDTDETICVVSALLHDIGHAPLSHSLEPVFKSEFGVGHHAAGEKILKGDVPIGKGLKKIFENRRIDPFEVMATISGFGPKKYVELFRYAINIDTIEAIIRCERYISKTRPSLNPYQVLDALINKTAYVLDDFWRLKDLIYSRLINSERGILADSICRFYIQGFIDQEKMLGSDRIDFFSKKESALFDDERYYFGNEKEFQRNHEDLFSLLKGDLTKGILKISPGLEEIDYVNRKFYIEPDCEIKSLKDLDDRYKQKKYEKKLYLEGGENGRKSNSDGEGKGLF